MLVKTVYEAIKQYICLQKITIGGEYYLLPPKCPLLLSVTDIVCDCCLRFFLEMPATKLLEAEWGGGSWLYSLTKQGVTSGQPHPTNTNNNN